MGRSTSESLRTVRIIGFVMLFTVPLYFLCAEFLTRNQERIILPLIKNVLTLVALLIFAAVLILRFRFLPEVSRAAGPADLAAMVARHRMVSIQGMAWSESVAIIGFALRFLGASRNYVLAFYVLGAFGILLFLRGSMVKTAAMRD